MKDNKFTYDALFAGEENVMPKKGENVVIVGGKRMIGVKRNIIIANSVWDKVIEMSKSYDKKFSNIVNVALIKYFEDLKQS